MQKKLNIGIFKIKNYNGYSSYDVYGYNSENKMIKIFNMQSNYIEKLPEKSTRENLMSLIRAEEVIMNKSLRRIQDLNLELSLLDSINVDAIDQYTLKLTKAFMDIEKCQ